VDVAEPRWLSSTEQLQWRTMLDTVRRLSRALERQLLADAGMPHAYYGILVALNEAPGRRVRMGDLAANVGFSPSRLSHAVARMEQAGWVERHPRPSSGRERDAQLTERGAEALTLAAPGHVALVRELLFDRLDGAELESVRILCERILVGLAECPAEQELLPEDECPPDGENGESDVECSDAPAG
jgi:DNA-binding MarR family transcriptional regulator